MRWETKALPDGQEFGGGCIFQFCASTFLIPKTTNYPNPFFFLFVWRWTCIFWLCVGILLLPEDSCAGIWVANSLGVSVHIGSSWSS